MGPNTSSIMKTARTRPAASRQPDDHFTSPSRQSSVRSSTYNNNRISPLLPRSTVSPHSRPQPLIVVQDQPVIGTASPTDINPISAHSEPSPPSAIGEAVAAVGASPIANNLDPCAAKGITLKLAQIDAEPGEYWLVVRDGWDPWPAIICDEAMVKAFFKKRRLSRVNSRRSDGTWGKHFKTGGDLVGKRLFPALLLALNSCVWVPCNRLRPLDLQMAIQKCNIPGKEDLSHAYQLAVMQKPLQYWEDIMIVHRRQLHRNAVANENIEVAREGGISANSIEAKSEISFRIPPGFVSNEGDKPENSLFLTPPPSARKGVKREFEDGMSPEDMKALYEDSDTEEALERSRARKRVKVETLPTQQIHSSEHVVKIEVQAPAHDETVQIYVDNPFKIFVISKENVKQSPLLKSLLSYQPSEGWCIMSPVLSRFHAKAFEAVVEYLNGAEYTPRLLNDGKADVRLENITTNSAKAAQVLNSGILYCMAGKLQLRAMKDLALRKLRVLSPYPPSMFIPIVGLVFQHGCARDDVEIRELLVEHIAEDYWELQKKEPRQFMEVMTTFPELDASVTARRAKGPKREVAFIKIEDD